MRATINSYYRLTKPGIVYGNALHILACALFATAFTGFMPLAIVGGIVGTSLVIASACVVNCISDRFIDAKMERTKKRPLPSGELTVRAAIIFAGILGLVGCGVLLLLTNVVTLVCALICHVTYTALYAYVKRHSWTSTMVGTIPGAMPALAGYASVDPSLPLEAWLLALVVLVWQLPHFYALSLYRRDDYAKSGLPLISVVKPRAFVVQQLIVTAVLYAVVAGIAFRFLPGNPLAGGVMFVSAVVWVLYVIFAKNRGTDAWARKVFGTSLYMPIAILVSSVLAVAMA